METTKDLNILKNLTDEQLLGMSEIISFKRLKYTEEDAGIREILKELFGNDSPIHIPELTKLLFPIIIERLFEYKKSSPLKDFATKEERDLFNDIMRIITCKKILDKYPNSVFYMSGDTILIEQDLVKNILFLNFIPFRFITNKDILLRMLCSSFKSDIKSFEFISCLNINSLEEELLTVEPILL